MLIYQVYPRSFKDSNGDGIGDLPGITARLDHIASLGVDMVWIGPCFTSPMDDFGYDVADYRDIDPSFGTLADFAALVAAARAHGMGVMVDMVVSHTSDRHAWFQASRLGHGGNMGKADKADWYVWADALADGSPPNNWVSVFGGGAWTWDAERRQYYFHTFLESQPDLNFHNPAVQARILEEMAFWLKQGVAGFRLDACNHYFQDLQLRSNPPAASHERALHPYGFQNHLYDKNRPEVPAFLARVRALLDEHGAYSVAEVGGTGGAQLAIDYVAPGRLHSAYNFDLLRTQRSAAYVRGVLQTLETDMPGPGVACHALSNHDKPRVATRWGEGREPVAHAKQMLALLACLKGTICLYQGEELGLPEAEVPFDRLQDPFGKRFWPKFKGRDGCRTPMPWDANAHAGFSSVEPWLPIDARHLAMNVAAQRANPHSVLSFACQVFALRRARPELDRGDFTLVDAPHEVLQFERQFQGATLVCAFNLGDAVEEIASVGALLMHGQATHSTGRIALASSGFVICEKG